jgi:hypothetical protein
MCTSQVTASLETIRNELANDFAPKASLDDSISVLKKRIIDLEWKMMRRKAEVSSCPKP